ncbi:MAG: flavin reductase family protein [Tractidigestivibacter sp.]|jgi:flavin reductase (DIM6/NTAB) family NADH-FMN oxidoreductase RutF|uniref:flavin reductase family protein n=1 Tax=Tractidigestivibacter sp. TaxID=2847320 RepID=UPI003D9088F3
MARKDLGARPYLFPQPVLILGTYDEDGTPNAMNAAWGGVVGADEIMIDLSEHKTTDNIVRNKEFTVSMGTAEHLKSCDYVGMVSGKKEPGKVKRAGFTVAKSEKVNAPIINELPVTLECKLEDVIGGSKYLAKIVNVSVDESVLGSDGDVSLDLFHPITYETAHHSYYSLGKKEGDAFHDGAELK